MELTCAVKNYHWGKKGETSGVANMVKSADSQFVVEPSEAYAELWMGTHQSGPSIIKADGTQLGEYIARNKETLGSCVDEKEFAEGLPFLFKVLSVERALSIQVHPDKKSAERLHKQQPDVYKDPNHKPELAVALTPFEAFCGFRSEGELRNYISTFPELEAVVGDWSRYYSDDPKTLVKNCFETMLDQKPETIADQLTRLMERLSLANEVDGEVVELLKRLHEDYPGDVGCFGYFFFNHVKLQPGEAIYIGANEPHAYLSGDCIECMACSDNVIRAGLTPKPKDIANLKEMLTYASKPASSLKLRPSREDECTAVFRPPVRDFAVAKIIIKSERGTYDLIPRSTASILLIADGRAKIADSKPFNRGSVLFVPANETTKIELLDRDITMFQAFVNI